MCFDPHFSPSNRGVIFFFGASSSPLASLGHACHPYDKFSFSSYSPYSFKICIIYDKRLPIFRPNSWRTIVQFFFLSFVGIEVLHSQFGLVFPHAFSHASKAFVFV
eukprot:TRINITY_DN7486_c0_g1_i4.p1 TRINITY_DN7486_c0_g1~~TRINITY_DN7486_c0_g1_i4.p1  ORF type:complete len:106 (+),score=4.63 TRINITY_DN7486_c0_g1_i4:67-384(+)